MAHTKKEIEEMSYSDLQALAKLNSLKASGKKTDLIERLVETLCSGNSTTKTTTTTTKTVLGKKRKIESSDEEESDSDDATQDEFETPVAPVRKASAKRSPAVAAATNKRVKQDEETKKEETKEDDSDTDNEVLPKQKTTTTTTTTSTTKPTTATKVDGADKKLVGPFDKSEDDVGKWIKDDSITYYLGELVNRSKIASFDMDSTLVINPSGKTHAISKDDWAWWHKSVPDNLRNLYKDGYQVVIFTNQGGIAHGSKFNQAKWNQITQKICILEKELGFPLVAFIACADDANRKPNRKMWDMMYTCTDGKVILNESDSFYCGDAAGRPDGWKTGVKKDFSNSDLGFAMTVEIRFETPETYFLGEAPFVLAGGDDVVSSLIPKAPTTGKRFEGDDITTKEFEVVVSTGFPASGKSTFARKHFGPAGYEIVNQDTLKTKDKCIKAVEAALKQGKSVIVDNTNYSKEVRAEYINLARKYKASTRSLHFTTSKLLAEHLNYYRERTLGVKHIPSMVYNIYNKNFVEPSTNEGFKSVTKINFVLELEEKDKKQYYIPNPKAKPIKE